LLHRLTPDELDAVIGHELGHIASGDMNRMQMAIGYQTGLIWPLTAIIAILTLPLTMGGKVASRAMRDARTGSIYTRAVAMVIQTLILCVGTAWMRWFSRQREFYADAVGAALTSPDAMLRALRKIAGFNDSAEAGEIDHKMLMFRASWGGHWFATHPSLEQRIAALRDRTYLARIEALAGIMQEPEPLPAVQLPRKYQRTIAKYQPTPPTAEPIEWPETPRWAQLLGLFLVGGALSFYVGFYVL
jgi:Zn-dependent protease with chaperone function